jgi:hypothetical protein
LPFEGDAEQPEKIAANIIKTPKAIRVFPVCLFFIIYLSNRIRKIKPAISGTRLTGNEFYHFQIRKISDLYPDD